MIVIDNPEKYVGKWYDKKNFHCWTLIEKCLEVPTLAEVTVDTALNDVEKYIDLFTEIKEPYDYCIALLGASHIGIYFRDGIYHADEPAVRWEFIRNMKIKYKGIKYYDIC